MNETVKRFNVNTESSDNKKRILYTFNFKNYQQHFLIYLFDANIILRTSGINETRTSEVYFLDQIVQGVQQKKCYCLDSIFIKHMQTLVRSKKRYAFLYTQFLIIPFQKVKVKFFGLKSMIIKPANILGEVTCKRFAFLLILSEI